MCRSATSSHQEPVGGSSAAPRNGARNCPPHCCGLSGRLRIQERRRYRRQPSSAGVRHPRPGKRGYEQQTRIRGPEGESVQLPRLALRHSVVRRPIVAVHRQSRPQPHHDLRLSRREDPVSRRDASDPGLLLIHPSRGRPPPRLPPPPPRPAAALRWHRRYRRSPRRRRGRCRGRRSPRCPCCPCWTTP